MTFLLTLSILFACKEPPLQAPSELEDLCQFIYSHFTDEDTTELIAGVENLHDWLYTDTNLGDAVDGYQINNLDEETINNLDGQKRSVGDNLAGASVAYRHNYPLEDLIQATLVEYWPNITEDDYSVYERDIEESPACLQDKSCDWLEYDIHSISSWVGGFVTSESYYHGQLRGIETKYGWIVIQRTWLHKPSIITPESLGIKLNQQYYFAAFMEAKCNGSLHISANWLDSEYGVLPVSEDWAKTEIVKTMSDQERYIENWLSDNR